MRPGNGGFLKKYTERVHYKLGVAANVRRGADENFLNTIGEPPDKAEKVARETMFLAKASARKLARYKKKIENYARACIAWARARARRG